VHARTNASTVMQVFRLQDGGAPLLRGKSVGTRIGAGAVRVIRGTEDLHRFQPGEVLVAQMTDPDWEPVLRKAAAIVTDRGGRTCHAAIVSRATARWSRCRAPAAMWVRCTMGACRSPAPMWTPPRCRCRACR
jgi:hypothetical protein